MPLDYLAALLCRNLGELEKIVYYLYMSNHHSSAAIPSKSKLVENFGGSVPGSDPLAENFPLVPDELTTRETTNRNNH